MIPDWLQLVIGPAGALVLAVLYGWGAVKELRAKHSEQIAQLLESRDLRIKELTECRTQLQNEHAARLQDARETTRTLLDLNDRIHRTLDGLEALTRIGTRTPTRPSRP